MRWYWVFCYWCEERAGCISIVDEGNASLMATTRQITRLTLFGGVIVLLLCLSVFPASGQAPKETNVVHVEAYASHESIHSAKSFHIAIIANIKKGFHINSHKPLDAFLKPTVLRLNKTRGIAFGSVRYPKPKQVLFSFSSNHLSVYDGKISIFAEGKVAEDVAPGDIKISGVFVYQACDDQACFMPESVSFEIPLKVVKGDEPASLINKHIFKQKALLSADELRAKQVD